MKKIALMYFKEVSTSKEKKGVVIHNYLGLFIDPNLKFKNIQSISLLNKKAY